MFGNIGTAEVVTMLHIISELIKFYLVSVIKWIMSELFIPEFKYLHLISH